MIVDVPTACTTYQYNIFLFKEPKEIEMPMAGGNTRLGYEVINSDNKLNPAESAVNIAEAAMGLMNKTDKK